MGFVFGAYTSIPWASPSSPWEWKRDPKAFLFTLTNPSNMPLKLKIKAGEPNAVCHQSGWGPKFGIGDLVVSNESNTNMRSWVRSHSYDAPNGQTGKAAGIFIHGGEDGDFQTEEIEVFQVI